MPGTPVLAQQPVLAWQQQLLGGFRLVQTGGTTVTLPKITMTQSSSALYRNAIASQISLAYYYGSDFGQQLTTYATTGVDFELIELDGTNILKYQQLPRDHAIAFIDPSTFDFAPSGSGRAVAENWVGPDFRVFLNTEVLGTFSAASFETVMGSILAHELVNPQNHNHRQLHAAGANATAAQLLADPPEAATINFLWMTGQKFYLGDRVIDPAGKTYAQFAQEVAESRVLAYRYRALMKAGPRGNAIKVDSLTDEELLKMEQIDFAGSLGGIAGAALGRYFSEGDLAKGVLYSSLLGEIGERLAVGIAAGGNLHSLMASAVDGGIGAAFGSVAQRMREAGIGSVSSLLAMEVGEAIGLDGFGAELFNTVGSTVLGKAVSNLVATNSAGHLFDGFNLSNLGDGFGAEEAFSPGGAGTLVANAVGTFLGAKLGALVVAPQTQAAVALSSVGSAVGGYAALQIGNSFAASLGGTLNLWGNVLFPGVGAFVGFVLGSLIGNLFGRKKPKTPTASAETVLVVPNARYELGAATSANGGNVDLVTSMATSARDTLNGLIQWVTFSAANPYVANVNGLATDQRYGHSSSSIYVTINGVTTNFDSADKAVEYGTLTAIRNTQIVAGDILLKRAILRSPATQMSTLAGDLQIASDMRFYQQNHAFVDEAIKRAYGSLTSGDESYYASNKALIDKIQLQGTSALTSGELTTYQGNQTQIDKILAALEAQVVASPWIITLQRAAELGLAQFASSDFYGGMRGFLDSFKHAGNYESVSIAWDGGANGLVITGDTRFPEGAFRVLPQASADGRSVTIGNFASVMGYSAGTASAGNDVYLQSTSFTPLSISFGAGDDIVHGSFGGDWLHGNQGEDFLDGNNGNDTVVGGAGNDVALGRDGNDWVTGDGGDDYLFGGSGADDARGGEGNDTIGGGGGADTMFGGNGNDVLLSDYNDSAADYIDGEGGSDQLSFERYAAGVAVNLASGSIFGDTVLNIEGLRGSAYDDNLTATNTSALLEGGTGNDTLTGLAGNDTLAGGEGGDSLVGGSGVDALDYQRSSGGVWVSLSQNIAVGGDAEGDVFSGIENILGSRYKDVLEGDAGTNRLTGLDGDDWFIATAGSDVLDGGLGVDFVDYRAATSSVYLDIGSSLATAPSNGAGYSGLSSGQTYISIEGVIGGGYADTLYGQAGDQTFIGGGGNDVLSGGAGSDTYVWGLGTGYDTVYDDNTGSNTLSLTGVDYSNLWFGTGGGSPSTPNFQVQIVSTGEQIEVVSNFQFTAARNVIKSLNIDGVGQIDIGYIDYGLGGGVGNDTLNGTSAHYDWLMGYEGDDILRGAWNGSSNVAEFRGNVVIAGKGGDIIYTSSGDDQFVMELGDGVDVISDDLGDDTLVFGPTVAAEDVIYERSGRDLWVGVRDAANPSLTASQVSTRVRIDDGAVQFYDLDTGNITYDHAVEFINVGGAWIDVTKLDIDWYRQNWSSSGGSFAPIIFDLDGDGLNLTRVRDTDIAVKGEDGKVGAVAWAGPTEGFLAVDRNGDKKIDRASEISFTQDAKGAKTDLEGLRGWDTNGDGVLDAKDERFGDLLIWVDEDQNGQSTPKELRTLKEAGIASIDLKGQETVFTGVRSVESTIQHTLTATGADGSKIDGYDVTLASRALQDDGEVWRVAGDALFGTLKDGKQVDFSGAVNDRAIARWSNKPDAKPGQVGFEGLENLAGLTAARRGNPKSGSASGALAFHEEAPVAASVEDGDLAAPLTEDMAGGLDATVGELRPVWADTSATAPLDPRVMFAGSAAPQRDWWRAAQGQSLGFADEDRLGPVTSDAYDGVSALGGWSEADAARGESIDPHRQQLLLRQAMAGFGGDAGGSAAVWTRGLNSAGSSAFAGEARLRIPLHKEAA